MKVLKVRIKDYKVIKNLEKEINGNNILLLGDNGVGKSSFIQFIELALGKTSDLPEVKTGEGQVIVDKNGQEWTFNVEFKKGKPQITLVSPEGFKDTRKSVIANVVGAMDFDIDEFVQLSDSTSGRKKQIEIYKSFLPQEIREFMESQEARVKRAYDERTEKNREAKMLEGYIAEHPYKKIFDMPERPVDTKQLTEQIESALEHNKKVLSVKERLVQRQNEVLILNAQIKELEDKRKELEKMNESASDWLVSNSEIDVSSLMTQKDSAYEINSAFEKRDDFLKQQAMLESLKSDSGELTAFIESSKQAIEDAIRDCDVPVEGLTFDEDSLIYNGIPVTTHNLSSSEIMHLGCKLKMAENKDLGILFIQRGESLGAKRLKEIQEMAQKYDWQIIMEQVDRGNEKLTIEIMQ